MNSEKDNEKETPNFAKRLVEIDRTQRRSGRVATDIGSSRNDGFTPRQYPILQWLKWVYRVLGGISILSALVLVLYVFENGQPSPRLEVAFLFSVSWCQLLHHIRINSVSDQYSRKYAANRLLLETL